MKIILPPSETKVSGGKAGPLSLSGLAFPQLTSIREHLVAAVELLSEDAEEATRVLKLGPKQSGEVLRNRELRTSATMPAIERYTGVLYDAIGYSELASGERRFLGDHTLIQSALFGIVSAKDHIPAYRLSYNSAVLGRGHTLKKLWHVETSSALNAMRGLILDLRSGGYADLGPISMRDAVLTLSVMTRAQDGSLRALNHFNKKGKGEVVRSIAQLGHSYSHPEELVEGLRSVGLEISITGPNKMQLITDSL